MTAIARARTTPWRAMLVLGVLEAFGPLSMDVYLPQLPQIATDFGTSDTLAQATMSACMIGLGGGQLVAGPLSDRFGRRYPLMLGVAIFAVLSACCAIAPTIELLIVERFMQGLAGSAGIVITLAIARDLFSGVELSRMLSLLLLVSGSTPIIAPLIGGQLARIMDWRGVFWVLAGVGVALFVLAAGYLPETLGRAARHTGGLAVLRSHARAAVRDPLFVAVLVTSGAGGIAFFSYLSMSSFVFEDRFGFTPQTFSLVFAANALASIGGAQVSRVVVSRVGPRAVYLAALAMTSAATLSFLALTLANAGAGGVMGALLVFMFCSGAAGPNGNALALAHHGARAGTAAALMGSATYSLGPIVVPLAALGGTTAVIMAVTMTVASAAAMAVAWLFVQRSAP